MKPLGIGKRWSSRTVQLKIVDSAQWQQGMHDAIARRAFVNFESRESRAVDASADWRRAESEMVRPLECGFIVGDKKVSVETDASAFEEGPIEIFVEPRRLMMCGTCRPRAKKSPAEPIFYVLDLPVAIDPSRVTTRFNGCVLLIDLPLREECRTSLQARDEKDRFLNLRPASGAMLH